jgi:hypothetical protein
MNLSRTSEKAKSNKFLSVKMSLMSIARLTMSYFVTYKSTHYNKQKWQKLIKVLRYLRDFSNDGITTKCEEL